MSKKNHVTEAAASLQRNSRNVNHAAKAMRCYQKTGEGLSKLNTMRGGTKGFKGFVMEELEAGKASSLGRHTEVINNNGLADLRYIKTDGTEVYLQMKSGYKPGQIDFSRYKGQTVVIDKGNVHFKALQAAGRKAGVKVVEGHVADAEAKALADLMQLETKITGSKNAVVTSNLYSGAQKVSAAHGVGLKSAKSGSVAGAGFSIGNNIVAVAKGNKTVGEAAGDVAIDTVKAGAIGYGAGAVGSVVASTAAGAAAIETVGAAAAAVSSAPVIGTAITTGVGAVTAAGGAISAGTTAALTTVGLSAAAPIVAAAAPFVVAGALLGLFFDD